MIKKADLEFYQSQAGNTYNTNNAEDRDANKRITKNLYSVIIEASKKAASQLFDSEKPKYAPHASIPTNKENQRFRDHLFVTFSPKSKYSKIVTYWINIEGKPKLKNEFFSINLSVYEKNCSDILKQKNKSLQKQFELEKRLTIDTDISEEQLTKWIVKSINEFEFTYDDLCRKLQPELDDALLKMMEREEKKIKNQKIKIPNEQNVNKEGISMLNRILYGPPGTGKTFNTINHALSIADPDFQKETKLRKEIKERFDQLIKEGKIVFTTFHQSMSYEDFIEGIKPDTNKNGAITYEIKSGIFKELCDSAKKDTNKNYVLIIDEINRGNVSQIFGELITLIEDDKRLGKSEGITITLPYSKKEFGVPSNVFIIGTMNTADRSVEALDAALRRRFSFIEMPAKPNLIKTEGKLKDNAGIIDDAELGKIDLAYLLEVINKRIEKLLDSDHQIGHSFFLPVSSISSLKEVFQNKIIPLLKEYFYGDFGKLGLVLGKGFFEPIETSSSSSFANFEDFDSNDLSERVIYKLKNISSDDELSGMNNNDFFEAINKLLNK